MTIQKVPVNDAQNEFKFVMDQVCSGLGPVLIAGIQGNAVLVCESDWKAMQKNLQDLRQAVMGGSTIDGMSEGVQDRSGEKVL
jgi:PHD/YefM family antitoxin component YafN of YafNO toxin-antitoxin module